MRRTSSWIEGGDTASEIVKPSLCLFFRKGKKEKKERGIRTERSTQRGLSQNINALNPLWIARCKRFYARLNEAENTYVYNNWDEKNDEKMGSSIIAIVQIA